MTTFKTTEAIELMSLAYYTEKISIKAEKSMLKGNLNPENLFLFKKLVNEIAEKNKEIISKNAVDLLGIDEGKRIKHG